MNNITKSKLVIFFSIVHRVVIARVTIFCVCFQNEEQLGPNVSGDLCMKVPWPGIARTIWGSHEDFLRIYFEPHPGIYIYVHVCVPVNGFGSSLDACNRLSLLDVFMLLAMLNGSLTM